MSTWEYRTFETFRNDELRRDEVRCVDGERLELEPFPRVEVLLNSFGTDGWELVGFSNDDGRSSYVFKRPRVDD